MFVAHSLTHRANRSVFSRSKSPGFRNFPNTLSEAFLIAFRYGDGMVLARMFLCSVDSASPDEVLTQNRAGQTSAGNETSTPRILCRCGGGIELYSCRRPAPRIATSLQQTNPGPRGGAWSEFVSARTQRSLTDTGWKSVFN